MTITPPSIAQLIKFKIQARLFNFQPLSSHSSEIHNGRKTQRLHSKFKV